MKKDIGYYSGLATEAYQDGREKRMLYSEIDKHRLGEWKPSASLGKLPWIQGHNFSSTQPADALDSGARTFATMMPNISVAPLDDSTGEYERVEKIETILDWHLHRMNMWGRKTPHWQILENAMYYCSVAFETEYLPHKFKGQENDKRIKQLLNGSHFRWTVHPRRNVSPLFSQYGMEACVLHKPTDLQHIMYEYGADNPGVQKVIAKVFKGKIPSAQKALQSKFTLIKVKDWDNTVAWLVPSAGNEVNAHFGAKENYELMNEEHGLDFIPWVVTDNEDPILKNAINTGLLDNLNNMRLINFSIAVGLAAASQQDITTPDGTLRGVRIDNQNPVQPIVHGPSVQVKPLPQPQLPQGIQQMEQQMQGEVSSTTVAKILSDANRLMGTENFSTANLAWNIALGSLSLARDAAERAYEQGLYQMFQWIEHTKDKPLIAFRPRKSEYGKRGQEMVIKSGDFDTRYLYIDVKLKEFHMMDEQAKTNLAITQVERLGLSRQVVAEAELGIENYALHEMKRGVEDVYLAMIQGEAKKIMGEADLYLQQKMMELQQAQQQQAQQQAQQQQAQQQAQSPQGQINDMNAGFPVMEGADMRGGGMAAAQANPGETRETIQGLDAGGTPL